MQSILDMTEIEMTKDDIIETHSEIDDIVLGSDTYPQYFTALCEDLRE